MYPNPSRQSAKDLLGGRIYTVPRLVGEEFFVVRPLSPISLIGLRGSFCFVFFFGVLNSVSNKRIKQDSLWICTTLELKKKNYMFSC